MKKRLIGALAALCLLVATFVATTPSTQVQATVTWPLEVTGTSSTVIAHENGNFSVLNCAGYRINARQATYFNANGQELNVMEGYASIPAYCDNADGDPSSDGTLYETHLPTSETSELVAQKNNRQLWAVATTSPVTCSYASSTDKRMRAASVSVPGDGNVYMVLQGFNDIRPCPDRLFAVNQGTGAVVFDVALSSGPPGGGGWVKSKVWAYNDKLVVLDAYNVVRKFSYAGVEDTGAAYTFSVPSGYYPYQFLANSEGTVFVGISSQSPPYTSRVLYQKEGGSTGYVVTSGYQPILRLASDGNVVATKYDSLSYDTIDISTDTKSVTTLTNPDPINRPNAGVAAYAEDENGNGLAVVSFANAAFTDRAVAVDLIDGSTSAVTEEFYLEKDSGTSGSPNPWFLGTRIDESVQGGYLYLILCHEETYNDCTPASESISRWIHKIDVSGFGDALVDEQNYSGFVDTRLQYVAMGDSFSSGEGNPPFLDTGNQCDRSVGAYAQLLTDPYYGLGLKLVDHVACSGATIAEVLAGKYDEPAQTSALGSETDIVTISIGGNDALFAPYVVNCIYSGDGGCGPGSIAYAAVTAVLDNPDYESDLGDLYATILTDAPNADVFVVGYPYVTPVDPSDPYCLPFQDYSDGSSVTDSQAARNVVDMLNDRSEDAVDTISDSRLHFVDPTLSGNPFVGHDVCSSVPYFVYPLAPGAGLFDSSNWFHPNIGGQMAYADWIAAAM